jgi:hypothetical protein
MAYFFLLEIKFWLLYAQKAFMCCALLGMWINLVSLCSCSYMPMPCDTETAKGALSHSEAISSVSTILRFSHLNPPIHYFFSDLLFR